MTGRQRAALATIIYTIKNQRYFNWHNVGVKLIPDGQIMYNFRGEVSKNTINLVDDKYNRIISSHYLTHPFGIELEHIGRRGTDRIKLRIPEKSSDFYGLDGELFRFEGRYFASSLELEIRDSSQDRDKYVYRITW